MLLCKINDASVLAVAPPLVPFIIVVTPVILTPSVVVSNFFDDEVTLVP